MRQQLIQNAVYYATEDVRVEVGIKACCPNSCMFDRYVQICSRENVLLHHSEWYQFFHKQDKFLLDFYKAKGRFEGIHRNNIKILFGTMMTEREIIFINEATDNWVVINEEAFKNILKLRECIDYHLQWLNPRIEVVEHYLSTGTPRKIVKYPRLLMEMEHFYKN